MQYEQQQPCLWRVKSKEYLDKVKSEAPYHVLLKIYRLIDVNANKDAVVKKINAFRTNYRREKKKSVESLDLELLLKYMGLALVPPLVWLLERIKTLQESLRQTAMKQMWFLKKFIYFIHLHIYIFILLNGVYEMAFRLLGLKMIKKPVFSPTKNCISLIFSFYSIIIIYLPF